MLRIDKWAFSCGPTATLQLSSHLMYLHCILSFTCNKHRNMSISHVRNKMSSRPLKSCAEYEKTWRKRPFGPSNAPEPLHEVNKTKEIHYEKKTRTGIPLRQVTHRNASSHHVEGTPLTHARAPFRATRLQHTNRRRTRFRADAWSSPLSSPSLPSTASPPHANRLQGRKLKVREVNVGEG